MVQTSNPNHEFAARLKEAMTLSPYRGYGAAAKLARDLGVTSKAVSKWLNGESSPTQDRMLDLAKLLGARVEWLMWGNDLVDDGVSEPRILKTIDHYAAELGLSKRQMLGEPQREREEESKRAERRELQSMALEDYDPRTTELNIRLKDSAGRSRGYSIAPCMALENGHLPMLLLDALREDLGEFFQAAVGSHLVKISLEFEEPLTHEAKVDRIMEARSKR